MNYNDVKAELEKISESDPVQFKKLVMRFFEGMESSEFKAFIKRVLGVIKIQKATKVNEKFVRFSISKWSGDGKKRDKYIALGKILKEKYEKNSEAVDDLCSAGDVEGLLSKTYFVLKEEKGVLEGKIADFYEK